MTDKNNKFESLSDLKKLTIIELRDYIMTNDSQVTLERIKRFSDCISYIEEKGMYSRHYSSMKTNDKPKTMDRDETITHILSLENNPNSDELSYKITHNGARIAVKVRNHTLFTLFVQNKFCNVAIREETYNQYLKYYHVPKNTDNRDVRVGFLSYGSQSTYLHGLSYDEYDSNGKILSHGSLVEFIYQILTLFGALLDP